MKHPQSVLFVGHLSEGQTSLMRANAMKALGLDVVCFDARAYLSRRSFLERRAGDLFSHSPLVNEMNHALSQLIASHRPSIIWCEKQEHLAPGTIARMKEVGATIVFYTPDPYFQQTWLQTKRSNMLLAAADVAVTTKSYELDEYRRHGDVIYMTHGFCERVHRPVPVPSENRVDLGFIGSWEPRREEFLERCAKNGLSVRIWGFGWDHVLSGRATFRARARLRRMANGEKVKITKNLALAGAIEAREVLGEAYAEALSASAISPGLLRTTLYPDQHTTRTFEIPACGSMLLAERTNEHEELFEEDREAIFFVGEDELVEKATFYARRPELRTRIAEAGRARCFKSGYSYTERLRPVMAELAERAAGFNAGRT